MLYHGALCLDDSATTKVPLSNRKNVDYDMIGSRFHPKAVRQEFVWTLAKPCDLQVFFDFARKKLRVKPDEEVRAWQKDPHVAVLYLIKFPWKFNLKAHRVVLEKARYPKFTEYLINVCKYTEDGVQSEYIPVIIEQKKSVKALKQLALGLLGEDPNDYKKWMCFDVTAGDDQRNKPWRESLTLNSTQCSPYPGARVALLIGKDRVTKQIELCFDQRALETPWAEVQGDIPNLDGSNNPYIIQEIGSIDIDGDATFEALRQRIYGLSLSVKMGKIEVTP